MSQKEAPETPWHEAFPPSSLGPDDIPHITRQEVLASLKTKASSSDLRFILVDLRRADHVGGQIRGSLNVPAQSMYFCMPTLYELFKKSGVETVIWFCGSSRGRGPRAAGWFHDFCQSKGDPMRSVVLEGGIKGWAAAGDEYIAHIDGFDPKPWNEQEKIEK